MKYDDIIKFLNKYINIIKNVLLLIITVIIPIYVYKNYEDVFAPYTLGISGMILGKVILFISIIYFCSNLINNFNKKDK